MQSKCGKRNVPGHSPGSARLPDLLWLLVPALALAVVLFAPGDPQAGKKDKIKKKDLYTVQVREAEVREAPSFLSPVVFRAGYTSRVQVTETAGPWRHIRVPDRDLAGWLLESALTEKQIVLEASNKKMAKKLANKKEQSLAGRSFQDEVEKKLKKKKRKQLAAGFTRLDQVVAATDGLALGSGHLALFRAEGELTPMLGPSGQPVQVGQAEPTESTKPAEPGAAQEVGP